MSLEYYSRLSTVDVQNWPLFIKGSDKIMSTNFFLASEAPDEIFVGVPASIDLTVGNLGTENAYNITVAKNLTIAEGTKITVLETGGATVAPEVGSEIAGPAEVSFVYTGIDLPASNGLTSETTELSIIIAVTEFNSENLPGLECPLASTAIIPAQQNFLEHSGAQNLIVIGGF